MVRTSPSHGENRDSTSLGVTMRKILGSEFFERPALVAARDLLGKYLVRRMNGREEALMITETEAYFGFEDKGSHAHRGQTARNTPMFMRGGIIYVYFTYGMHWMLNLVCGREGFPAAVLIRGVISKAEVLRGGVGVVFISPERRTSAELNGPAKLTKALGIDKSLNGKALGKKTGLWVEDRGVRIYRKEIKRTPRIGIPNRGVWTGKPWRFVYRSNK